MKIAFDIRSLVKKKTGIGYYTESLLEALLAIDQVNEYVLYAKKSFFSKKKKIPQFKFSNVRYSIDRFSFWKARGIRNCDVLVTTGHNFPKRKGQKMVVIVADVIHFAFPGGHTAETVKTIDEGLKRVVKDADVLVAISESTKRDLMKFYKVPEERIVTIYAGCNYCSQKPTIEVAQNVLEERFQIKGDYLLYVGTLEPRKNVENIIRAYGKLRSKGFSIPLVLAGMKGWMFESIFDTVRDLSLTDYVRFTDYVSYKEKQCLYRLAKLFVYPSLYEGFGLPVLEAMDYGIPVITSNCSSLPEVAGDAAIMVDPHNDDAMADCMEQLLTNEQLRNQLTAKGRERVKIFDWRLTAQGFLNIFQDAD